MTDTKMERVTSQAASQNAGTRNTLQDNNKADNDTEKNNKSLDWEKALDVAWAFFEPVSHTVCDVVKKKKLQQELDDNIVFKGSSACWPLSPLGDVVDVFDGNTKDGQIDNTKQLATGDCWLLSGINSLSYTEEGRKMIKEALEYKDGGTLVHLKGAGDYFISDNLVSQTKGSLQYSSGDDDMIILELAIEEALDDIKNGNLSLPKNTSVPWYLEEPEELESTKLGKSSTDGGFNAGAIYLLTGKESEHYYGYEDIKFNLEYYQDQVKSDEENNVKGSDCYKEHTAMGLGLSEDTKVKDINGKSVKLAGPHAYAIKDISDDIVTVINPWDSSKEIKLDIETCSKTFSRLCETGLSQTNQEEQYRKYFFKPEEVKKNPDGSETTIYRNENGYLTQEKTILDGKEINVKEYNDYGTKISEIQKEYDKNGKCVKTVEQSGRTSTENIYNPDGTLIKKVENEYFGDKVEESKVSIYYPDGSLMKESSVHYFAGTDKILESNIITYDENGNIVLDDNFDSHYGNSSERSINEYQYNDDGTKACTLKYYKDGTLEYIQETLWDAESNLIKTNYREYDSDNNLEEYNQENKGVPNQKITVRRNRDGKSYDYYVTDSDEKMIELAELDLYTNPV